MTKTYFVCMIYKLQFKDMFKFDIDYEGMRSVTLYFLSPATFGF